MCYKQMNIQIWIESAFLWKKPKKSREQKVFNVHAQEKKKSYRYSDVI